MWGGNFSWASGRSFRCGSCTCSLGTGGPVPLRAVPAVFSPAGARGEAASCPLPQAVPRWGGPAALYARRSAAGPRARSCMQIDPGNHLMRESRLDDRVPPRTQGHFSFILFYFFPDAIKEINTGRKLVRVSAAPKAFRFSGRPKVGICFPHL